MVRAEPGSLQQPFALYCRCLIAMFEAQSAKEHNDSNAGMEVVENIGAGHGSGAPAQSHAPAKEAGDTEKEPEDQDNS